MCDHEPRYRSARIAGFTFSTPVQVYASRRLPGSKSLDVRQVQIVRATTRYWIGDDGSRWIRAAADHKRVGYLATAKTLNELSYKLTLASQVDLERAARAQQGG